MSGAIVSVDRLSVARGTTQALKQITFDLKPGQIVGLVGPSGSGKSTLMRTLVGLQKNTEGSVEVFEHALGSSVLRDQIGYMAQSPSIYPDLTVKQNIIYFAHILGCSKSEIERVIKVVDLLPQQGQLAQTLSGGQRARVSLAIALLGQPPLLVLDEPTVGLDPVLRNDLWALFRGLSGEGVTLIISSHNMEEAARCDHLLLVRDGTLLAHDSVEHILSSTSSNDIEAAFLKLVNGDADV